MHGTRGFGHLFHRVEQFEDPLGGSGGRLQQINVMNAPSLYAPDPSGADILVHETVHRWAAYALLDSAPFSDCLLDGGGGHWNVHVHTGGPSTVGYGDLVDLGGGRFRFTVQYPLLLSPLELYLAGFIPPEEVPPMFYVVDAGGYEPPSPSFGGAWSAASYGEDVEFSGTRVDFAIGDVIGSNGPRVPGASDAPRQFRFAFVLVCRDAAACCEEDAAVVEAQRRAFPARFAAATGGRATIDATL